MHMRAAPVVVPAWGTTLLVSAVQFRIDGTMGRWNDGTMANHAGRKAAAVLGMFLKLEMRRRRPITRTSGA